MGYAFYFLQTLAIHRVVYRRIARSLDFQHYVLAVSFCGAFLAGPIFNQEQLLKIETLEISFPVPFRIYKYFHFLVGALLFKYVFANWLSQWVVLSESSSPLLIARSVLCFELQVYFDFAGYSLLSFFLCRIFGIAMYHNFQHPFAARNIPEFWRRWHTGLGTFFKENIYLPLKSAFPGQTRMWMVAPMIVFLVSAAWHGPTRNFLLWGLFHGMSFVLAVSALKMFPKSAMVRWGGRLFLFIVLFYGRLLFMESDFDILIRKFRRLGMMKQMFHEFTVSLPAADQLFALFLTKWDSFVVGFGVLAFVAYEVFFVKKESQGCYRYFRPGILSLVLLMIVFLFFQPAHHAGFVYGR
jgi:alginate O-acetyltransferase complex protein AlgI